MEHMHVHGTYDSIVVIFSYIVAIVSSYTVLNLVSRISSSTGPRRWLWLLYGSLVMGTGIWSMHFVGMLAFSLPIPVAYDLMIVVLSILVAIAASFIALLAVGRNNPTIIHLLGGGIMLAIGISSMHYIGMAAMIIDISYDPFYFTLSIIVALIASITALWLSFYFRNDKKNRDVLKKLISCLIMGTAIVGMHYIGMIAANFHLGEKSGLNSGIMLEQKWLAYLISAGTLFTLILSIFGIFISRRLSQKDSEIEKKTNEIHMMNQELLLLNENLELLVKERTAQLELAHDEAIKANMVKSQFLANMSHELRTPLNAIIGYSEMLIEDAVDLGHTMFEEDLTKIKQAGTHLLTLINDILDISKVEAGKMEMFNESHDLSALIHDVMTTVKPLVEKNNNQIEAFTTNGEITTDITKLRQILMNLLSNASKFTKNGAITLRVSQQEQAGVAGYCFTITDTGIGMSPEQVSKLFQPFTQADESTTRQYGGTGLGLAISKHFTTLMGGNISVNSELGTGSVFTCWIPAQPPQTDELPSDTDITQNVVNIIEHASILLIDDEPLNGQLMNRYLEKEGWTLAFAENGQKGLELAKQLHPEVICLDILMPGMDGWSVLSILKNDPELKEIPVVIWSMTNDKHLGYSLGASEFLTKPVSRELLIEVIEKYIQRPTDHTVLVIEDDMTTSEYLFKLLHKEGYSVKQASNGQVALDYLEQAIPDLILLDLMMPVMDGFQFVAELRKRREWSNIPIIVLTAKSITQEDRLKLNGYVTSIIPKGKLDHKALLTKIQRFAATETRD